MASSTDHVMLEVKLNIPPISGFQHINEVLQKFTQHCNINQSGVSCMIMGKNSVTVNFQISALSLSVLEKKITDSEQSLSSMKVSLVKILGKTVFETDGSTSSKV